MRGCTGLCTTCLAFWPARAAGRCRARRIERWHHSVRLCTGATSIYSTTLRYPHAWCNSTGASLEQLYSDSEDNLGRGIAASPLGADAVVYTKVGKYIRWRRGAKISGPIVPWAPHTVPPEDRVVIPDYSKAGAAQSLKESLERMGLKSCHTLRLHDPDSIEGAIEQATDPENGIIAGLRELRAAGIIENVSFGMNANADHRIITAVSPRFTFVELRFYIVAAESAGVGKLHGVACVFRQ